MGSLPLALKVFLLASALCFVGFFIWTTPLPISQGTVKIYDKKNSLLFELAGNTGRKETVAYKKFPNYLVRAVIASEDESFYSHGGVDIKAMFRSFLLNLRSGQIVSGASTVSQQVARMHITGRSNNVFLRIVRKIRESVMAIRLSSMYSKDELLSLYLNEVYLGNHNYGFQSAASFYFHKDVDMLSLNESAYLVGMIASPSLYDPYMHKSDGEGRKAYVVRRMGANGFITKEQMDTVINEPCDFSLPDTSIKAPHFVDYIMDALTDLHITGTDISVYTTLDLPTYEISKKIASEWVNKLEEPLNVHNAAMLVVENSSGAILSMLGGINYYDVKNGGQVNVVTSPRQPGSSIKPVTYLAAFQKGITPATLIYDVKKSYPTKKGEGFIPNNFGDTYHGLALVREAFASSYNLPAVEVLSRIGIDSFLSTASALGITTFTGSSSYDYSVTLGANEVTLLELTNAYATIGRGGNYISPYAIEKILDGKGKSIYSHTQLTPVQKLGPLGLQASYLVTNILSDPMARMPGFGEKNFLTLSRPAAVKTGTTSDWHDVWTVGYTPSYSVGVWMGNNDNTAMRNISSGTSAAAVWNQFMEEYLKDKPYEEFTKPDGITTKEICAVSGDLYDSICPEKKLEFFIAGTEPTKISSIHKVVSVDTRNGLLAGSDCPQSVKEDKLLIDYPSEVYSWAVANNKPYIPHGSSPLCGSSDSGRVSLEVPLYISITNPKNKAVFQNAPNLIRNQGISFDVNVSSNITSVSWYVDDVFFQESKVPPFSVVFPLQEGSHIVYAKGRDSTDNVSSSEHISFRIVGYK